MKIQALHIEEKPLPESKPVFDGFCGIAPSGVAAFSTDSQK